MLFILVIEKYEDSIYLILFRNDEPGRRFSQLNKDNHLKMKSTNKRN